MARCVVVHGMTPSLTGRPIPPLVDIWGDVERALTYPLYHTQDV
jgi:hypothetical protein